MCWRTDVQFMFVEPETFKSTTSYFEVPERTPRRILGTPERNIQQGLASGISLLLTTFQWGRYRETSRKWTRNVSAWHGTFYDLNTATRNSDLLCINYCSQWNTFSAASSYKAFGNMLRSTTETMSTSSLLVKSSSPRFDVHLVSSRCVMEEYGATFAFVSNSPPELQVILGQLAMILSYLVWPDKS